jgi:Domain of unknown function (DUF4388)
MFMSQKRGTVTDRLLNVIQVLQLGKKTGHLTIERDEGKGQEKGEIIFVEGQVTQAYGGNLRGQEALNWLSTWGACRFIFVPATQEKITSPLATQTQPFMSSPKATQPLRDTNPRITAAIPTIRQKAEWTHTTQQMANSSAGLAVPHRTREVNVSFHLLDQARLSRAHRHLFLLIDGNRTVAELIRLTGRPAEEILRLLQELEHIGVIE